MSEETILPVSIEDEMRVSYMTYAMSVIIQRALPDVRDGLKPSQRRILVAMNDLNLSPGSHPRKCAKIAGDTSGNYHPHGEQVIYPTLVRLAQDFNMRYPLVQGQGNFGSIDGDPPAAMRYTEARMAAPALDILSDLDKETVDFQPNYDETKEEPKVLPSRFPNLIVNGATGIAVGMATSIPPHNLDEVSQALIALVDDPDLQDGAILEMVLAPDFPTGGIIYGKEGVRTAYLTGHGRVIIRARTEVEEFKGGRERIIITEIPYQINKTSLIERIADLVRDRQVEGISDLRDESDRDGMRIVVELKKGAPSAVILNQLFQRSQMQHTMSIILLALVNGEPRVLTLKEMLKEYINHRMIVIRRRTEFDLKKAEARAHILEGLRVALDNLDAVIELIRASQDAAEAKAGLMERFELSDKQAQAILDMRLQRLTGLEREKIEGEYLELIQMIELLRSILASEIKIRAIIKEEILELREKYGDDRRTDIIDAVVELGTEDLIAEEDMVVTISHTGYIKRLPTHTYRQQKRGGRGIAGASVKEDDFLEQLFVASTHTYLMFFTDQGRCYWLKTYQIPVAGRTARGKSAINLLQLHPGEKITAVIPTMDFPSNRYLMLVTKNGYIKKTALSEFSNVRKVGILAIRMDDGDRLIEAKVTDGEREVIIARSAGKAIRFREEEVRPMGRTARGVRGVSLDEDDEVVGMITLERGGSVLVVTENGYGKRTEVDAYRVTRRGGKGILTIIANERNGRLVSIKEVVDDDELMIITRKGIVIRMPVSGISSMGRVTQGVRVVNLDEGDEVVDVARLVLDDESDESDDGGETARNGDPADLPEIDTNGGDND